MPYGLTHHDMFAARRRGEHDEVGLRPDGRAPDQGRALPRPGPGRLFRQGRARSRHPAADRRQRRGADRRRRAGRRRAREEGRQGPVREGQQGRGHRGQQLRAQPGLQQDAGPAARARTRWCSRRSTARTSAWPAPFGARIARVPDITSLGFVVPGEEDRGGQAAVAQRAAGHRPAAHHRRQPQGQALRQRGLLPRLLLRDRRHRRRHPDPSELPLLGDHRQPGAREIPVRPDHARARTGPQGVGAVGRHAWPSWPRRSASTPAGLEATVAEFNVHAEKGEDPEFGRGTHPWSAWMCGDPFHKPNANLGTVAKGPFYAVELQAHGRQRHPLGRADDRPASPRHRLGRPADRRASTPRAIRWRGWRPAR